MLTVHLPRFSGFQWITEEEKNKINTNFTAELADTISYHSLDQILNVYYSFSNLDCYLNLMQLVYYNCFPLNNLIHFRGVRLFEFDGSVLVLIEISVFNKQMPIKELMTGWWFHFLRIETNSAICIIRNALIHWCDRCASAIYIYFVQKLMWHFSQRWIWWKFEDYLSCVWMPTYFCIDR